MDHVTDSVRAVILIQRLELSLQSLTARERFPALHVSDKHPIIFDFKSCLLSYNMRLEVFQKGFQNIRDIRHRLTYFLFIDVEFLGPRALGCGDWFT